MRTYRLDIPHWHPALLNTLSHGHWGKRARLKAQDKAMVWGYGQQIPKATGKRRVSLHIVLQKGQRAGDPDAYYKSLADALVHAGLLKNDSHRWVEYTPVQYSRDPLHWGTRITLEDLGVDVLPRF